MKNLKILYACVFLLIFIGASSFYTGGVTKTDDSSFMVKSGSYKSGFFEGKSQAEYTGEPYWGIVRIKIENGLFNEISFSIRDSSLHETFNGQYKKHFKGNPVYTKQCRKDWGGVKKYPKKLYKIQDIEKVDVVSGATWSYNIFKASVEEALKNAKAL